MTSAPNFRRLPLRDIMTDAEKRSRDMIDHLHTTWLAQSTELRDLSRPTRKKSQFPTYKALNNCLTRMLEIDTETEQALIHLIEEIEEILERARIELDVRR